MTTLSAISASTRLDAGGTTWRLRSLIAMGHDSTRIARAQGDRMNLAMSADLPGRPESAAAARSLVRQVLGEDHPSAGDAALVVSELVGNAVTHTRSGQPGGTITVAVETSAQPPAVCIRVRDAGGPGTPDLAAAAESSEHGRGLSIVAALAAEWGSQASETGRATWCRLTQDSNPASTPIQNLDPHEQARAQAADRNIKHGSTPADRKDMTDMKQPQSKDADSGPAGRPPEWAVVTWVNEQLRDRLQRNAAALADMSEVARKRIPEPVVDPQLEDREAEP
jgi:anti-sigma regulatory factor (Ser/Thr protein kinase)